MHGGISHLIWGDPRTDAAIAAREFAPAWKCCKRWAFTRASFVFPRDLDAHHAVLATAASLLSRPRAGPFGALRLQQNRRHRAGRRRVARAHSPAGLAGRISTRPMEPARFYVYLLSGRGALPLRSGAPARRADPGIGLKDASGARGVFHLALHPENLAESHFAFSVFEAMVHEICRWRDRHGVEVHSMALPWTAWRTKRKE